MINSDQLILFRHDVTFLTNFLGKIIINDSFSFRLYINATYKFLYSTDDGFLSEKLLLILLNKKKRKH